MTFFQTSLPVFVLLAFIGHASALSCFICVYYEGVNYSLDGCQNTTFLDPVYKSQCTLVNSVLVDHQTGAIINDTAAGLEAEGKVVGEFMCIKLTGHDKDTPSHSVFYRQCATQTVEDVPNVNGKCTQTTQDLTLKGFGTIAAGARQFVCTDDNCNGGDLNGFCGSKGADGGAGTSLQNLTSLGIVVLLTALAKLVS